MKLEPLDAIQPAVYNPRLTDPERLEAVQLSLTKLGFLHPLFATPSGTIISGHQRHLAASRAGFEVVPVERLLESRDEHANKALNLLFNRCTNDMRVTDSSDSLWESRNKDLIDKAKQMPDLEGPDRFPCLNVRTFDTKDLLAVNVISDAGHALNVAKSAAARKIHIPIVTDPDLRVVNGIGRLAYASYAGLKTVQVVVIPNDRAELARAMLNHLSMNFDVHGKYADVLRFNSFRRSVSRKKFLGTVFTFALTGGKPTTHFDVANPANRAAWTRHYGTTVLDFGAGLMTDAEFLKQMGVRCVNFEPFVLSDQNGEKNEVSPERSRDVCSEFLRELDSGVRFHSVFANAILNSVPFLEDRRKVLRILSAVISMCGPRTALYTTVRSVKEATFGHLMGAERKNQRSASDTVFYLGYEPNVSIGELANKPKVQKYHTADEVKGLLSEVFHEVRIPFYGGYVCATCKRPKEVDPKELGEALDFEFNLPYQDGSRMGLNVEARRVFAKRLGLKDLG